MKIEMKQQAELNSSEKNYRVKDLYLASFLHSQNKELITIEREHSTCWFVFSNRKACESQAVLFWAGKAEGNISQFTNSLKTLKNLIFSQE